MFMPPENTEPKTAPARPTDIPEDHWPATGKGRAACSCGAAFDTWQEYGRHVDRVLAWPRERG